LSVRSSSYVSGVLFVPACLSVLAHPAFWYCIRE